MERPASEVIEHPANDPEMAAISIEDLPVMDMDKASSISRLSEDFLIEMLGDFKSHYSEAAQKIGQHLADGNIKDAQSLAHTVKGISGSLGAEQVYQAATVLDAILKDRKEGEVRDRTYSDFETALGRLITYIDEHKAA